MQHQSSSSSSSSSSNSKPNPNPNPNLNSNSNLQGSSSFKHVRTQSSSSSKPVNTDRRRSSSGIAIPGAEATTMNTKGDTVQDNVVNPNGVSITTPAVDSASACVVGSGGGGGGPSLLQGQGYASFRGSDTMTLTTSNLATNTPAPSTLAPISLLVQVGGVIQRGMLMLSGAGTGGDSSKAQKNDPLCVDECSADMETQHPSLKNILRPSADKYDNLGNAGNEGKANEYSSTPLMTPPSNPLKISYYASRQAIINNESTPQTTPAAATTVADTSEFRTPNTTCGVRFKESGSTGDGGGASNSQTDAIGQGEARVVLHCGFESGCLPSTTPGQENKINSPPLLLPPPLPPPPATAFKPRSSVLTERKSVDGPVHSHTRIGVQNIGVINLSEADSNPTGAFRIEGIKGGHNLKLKIWDSQQTSCSITTPHSIYQTPSSSALDQKNIRGFKVVGDKFESQDGELQTFEERRILSEAARVLLIQRPAFTLSTPRDGIFTIDGKKIHNSYFGGMSSLEFEQTCNGVLLDNDDDVFKTIEEKNAAIRLASVGRVPRMIAKARETPNDGQKMQRLMGLHSNFGSYCDVDDNIVYPIQIGNVKQMYADGYLLEHPNTFEHRVNLTSGAFNTPLEWESDNEDFINEEKKYHEEHEQQEQREKQVNCSSTYKDKSDLESPSVANSLMVLRDAHRRHPVNAWGLILPMPTSRSYRKNTTNPTPASTPVSYQPLSHHYGPGLVQSAALAYPGIASSLAAERWARQARCSGWKGTPLHAYFDEDEGLRVEKDEEARLCPGWNPHESSHMHATPTGQHPEARLETYLCRQDFTPHPTPVSSAQLTPTFNPNQVSNVLFRRALHLLTPRHESNNPGHTPNPTPTSFNLQDAKGRFSRNRGMRRRDLKHAYNKSPPKTPPSTPYAPHLAKIRRGTDPSLVVQTTDNVEMMPWDKRKAIGDMPQLQKLPTKLIYGEHEFEETCYDPIPIEEDGVLELKRSDELGGKSKVVIDHLSSLIKTPSNTPSSSALKISRYKPMFCNEVSKNTGNPSPNVVIMTPSGTKYATFDLIHHQQLGNNPLFEEKSMESSCDEEAKSAIEHRSSTSPNSQDPLLDKRSVTLNQQAANADSLIDGCHKHMRFFEVMHPCASSKEMNSEFKAENFEESDQHMHGDLFRGISFQRSGPAPDVWQCTRMLSKTSLEALSQLRLASGVDGPDIGDIDAWQAFQEARAKRHAQALHHHALKSKMKHATDHIDLDKTYVNKIERDELVHKFVKAFHFPDTDCPASFDRSMLKTHDVTIEVHPNHGDENTLATAQNEADPNLWIGLPSKLIVKPKYALDDTLLPSSTRNTRNALKPKSIWSGPQESLPVSPDLKSEYEEADIEDGGTPNGDTTSSSPCDFFLEDKGNQRSRLEVNRTAERLTRRMSALKCKIKETPPEDSQSKLPNLSDFCSGRDEDQSQSDEGSPNQRQDILNKEFETQIAETTESSNDEVSTAGDTKIGSENEEVAGMGIPSTRAGQIMQSMTRQKNIFRRKIKSHIATLEETSEPQTGCAGDIQEMPKYSSFECESSSAQSSSGTPVPCSSSSSSSSAYLNHQVDIMKAKNANRQASCKEVALTSSSLEHVDRQSVGILSPGNKSNLVTLKVFGNQSCGTIKSRGSGRKSLSMLVGTYTTSKAGDESPLLLCAAPNATNPPSSHFEMCSYAASQDGTFDPDSRAGFITNGHKVPSGFGGTSEQKVDDTECHRTMTSLKEGKNATHSHCRTSSLPIHTSPPSRNRGIEQSEFNGISHLAGSQSNSKTPNLQYTSLNVSRPRSGSMSFTLQNSGRMSGDSFMEPSNPNLGDESHRSLYSQNASALPLRSGRVNEDYLPPSPRYSFRSLSGADDGRDYFALTAAGAAALGIMVPSQRIVTDPGCSMRNEQAIAGNGEGTTINESKVDLLDEHNQRAAENPARSFTSAHQSVLTRLPQPLMGVAVADTSSIRPIASESTVQLSDSNQLSLSVPSSVRLRRLRTAEGAKTPEQTLFSPAPVPSVARHRE